MKKIGAITVTENNEMISNSRKALECAKSIENRLEQRLERMEVINGYVMTTDREKWKKYNEEIERFV